VVKSEGDEVDCHVLLTSQLTTVKTVAVCIDQSVYLFSDIKAAHYIYLNFAKLAAIKHTHIYTDRQRNTIKKQQ